MLNTYLRSRSRWIAMGFLLMVACAAAGRSPQEGGGPDRREWPREIDRSGARITIYEPQLESLRGNRLTARAAVSVLARGGSEQRFGALRIEADLVVDPDRRTARLENLRISEVRFRNHATVPPAELRDAAAAEMSRWKPVYSMDALLAELRLLEERKAAAQALRADVPDILFRSHPAVLLSIEGGPEWRPAAGSRLRRLSNTAFFVVEDPEAGKAYLHVAPFWWTSGSALGPWREVQEVPGSIAELWKIEPKPLLREPDAEEEAPRRPEVIVATRPTELIWTDGPPQYVSIDGTNLLYVKNTASDVFLEIRTQTSYVLLSGRWFRTPYDKVAWEFVPSDQLPIDFSLIPLSSEKQHVLACVAGTPQAREAVEDAEIPRTEAVTTGRTPDRGATYDGDPRFEDIPECSVGYAVNSPYAIFCVDRRYYWCLDGIWYDSDCAAGPWFVCTWVPRVIYRIPPSCPYYYVTYCHVFSVSAGAVCVGYYPGYLGCYVWGRTIVYGTGWTYGWWTGSVCYERPVTWGVCVRYSPYACTWTYRAGWGDSYAWTGCTTTWRVPTYAVGVGGIRYGYGYRNGTGADVPVPVLSSRSDNLYVRPVAPETSRTRLEGTPAPPVSGRGPSLGRGSDGPRGSAAPSRREEFRGSPPAGPRSDEDGFKTPPAPPDRRESLRDPREIPRTPPRGPEHEAPSRPPPQADRREPPRAPPPVERREPPRNPPPPPPPIERREPPRSPPPPIERRDPPRNPPPQERRDPPRNPPQAERRDPPRNPPPPPPPQERREGPKERRR